MTHHNNTQLRLRKFDILKLEAKLRGMDTLVYDHCWKKGRPSRLQSITWDEPDFFFRAPLTVGKKTCGYAPFRVSEGTAFSSTYWLALERIHEVTNMQANGNALFRCKAFKKVNAIVVTQLRAMGEEERGG